MEKEVINSEIPDFLNWSTASQVASEGGDDIMSQEYDINDDQEIDESFKGILSNYYKLTEAFQIKRFIQDEVKNAGGLENLNLQYMIDKIEAMADNGKEIPDGLLAKQGLYKSIARFYPDEDLSSIKAQVRKGGQAPEAPKKEFNPDELDATTRQIFDAYQESAEDQKSVAESVEEKYDDIYYAVKAIASGKAIKRHALLYGGAGCGKTFMIKKALKEVFGEDLSGTNSKGQTCVRVNGSIGTSKSAVIAFFYKNRDKKVIFLDDCDGFLLESDQNIQNTLKGMLDPDNTVANPIPIHVPASICQLINKYLGLNDKFKESSYLDPLNLSKSRIREEEEFDDLDGWDSAEEDLSGYEDEESDYFDDDEVPIQPDNFEFHSVLVLASNLSRKDINAAVLSRCESIELNLSHEEFLHRLKTILPNMKANSDVDIPAEVQSYIYGVVFTYLSAVLTLAERGGTLLGKPIAVNRPLEFRLIPDLASKYQRCIDIYIDKKGLDGTPQEIYPKAAKEVEAVFLTKYLLPTLATV